MSFTRITPLQRPVIMCGKCQKPVEVVQEFRSSTDIYEHFYVKCHGDYRQIDPFPSDYVMVGDKRSLIVFKDMETPEPIPEVSAPKLRKIDFDL